MMSRFIESLSEGPSGGERLRLGLEAIHPGRSGILDAYATARDRPKSAAARPGGP